MKWISRVHDSPLFGYPHSCFPLAFVPSVDSATSQLTKSMRQGTMRLSPTPPPPDYIPNDSWFNASCENRDWLWAPYCCSLTVRGFRSVWCMHVVLLPKVSSRCTLSRVHPHWWQSITSEWWRYTYHWTALKRPELGPSELICFPLCTYYTFFIEEAWFLLGTNADVVVLRMGESS